MIPTLPAWYSPFTCSGSAAADGETFELGAEAGPFDMSGVVLKGFGCGCFDVVQPLADVRDIAVQMVEGFLDEILLTSLVIFVREDPAQSA